MKKTVQRYDIAFKVSEEKKGVIEESIQGIEKRYNISLNASVKRDKAGKGLLITCIQGLKTPQYKVSNAIFDLSTIVRAKCKVPTAIINKSNCIVDDEDEMQSIKFQHQKTMEELIKMGEQDNLFDGKAYANDIPTLRAIEALSQIDNPYSFLDDDELAGKADRELKIKEHFECRKETN